MGFTYRQVKDLYDTLHSAGVVTKSLPEWSGDMSAMTGTDLYDAGLSDNILKRASVGIDRVLEATPLPELGGDFGGALGGMFGMEEHGREIGKTLPRMAVDFLPMMAAGLATGGAAPIAYGAGLLGTGLLSGANTYTATGSPAAGIIAGGLNMVLPKVTGIAEQGALSFLRNRGLTKGVEEGLLPRLSQGSIAKGFNAAGDPLEVNTINQLNARSLGQSAFAETSGQLAAAGVLTGSTVGQQAFSDEGFQNPFTKEFALEQILTQIPFTALHLGTKAAKLGKSPMERADQLDAAIARTENAMQLKSAREALAQRTPVEQIPKIDLDLNDPLVQEANSRIASLGKQREDLKADLTVENAEKLKEVQDQETKIIEDLVEKTGGVGLGLVGRDPVGADKIPVLGQDHFFKQSKGKTGYHVITVAEGSELVGVKYPTSGEEVKVGDRIGFPAGFQDPPVNSDQNNPQFLLPRTHFTKVVDRPYERRVAQTGDEKTPELPLQKLALDLEGHRFSLKALEHLEAELATVDSLGAELDLLTKINAVRDEAGLPEIDYATLRKRAFKAKILGSKEATKAALAETRRIIEAGHDGIVERQALMQKEVEVQQRIVEQANDLAAPDPEAKKVLDLYDKLAGESGRRGEVATSGLFWQKAMELEAAGELSASRLSNWIEGTVVPTGAGLKKDITVIEKEIPPVIFKALESDEAALISLVGEQVARVTGADARSDEARVMRELFATGTSISKESISDAAVHLGIADEVDAGLFAEEFASNPKVLGWVNELKAWSKQNSLPIRSASGQVPNALANEYLPAIKVGDEIFEGQKGETHQEVLARYIKTNPDKEADAVAGFDSKENPNFFLRSGQPVSREQLRTDLGVSDSQGLKRLQEQRNASPTPRSEPFVPTSPAHIELTQRLTTDGHGLLQQVARDSGSDAVDVALANDLIKNFPEALKQIKSSVRDVGGNFAIRTEGRRIQIDLEPSLVAAQPYARNYVLLHEVVHGLTLHEMEGLTAKPELNDRLTALREKLISALPVQLKRELDQALATDWKSAWDAGDAKVTWDNLSSSEAGGQIIYSLLNNEEMVAQGFSSHHFRRYMQNTKGPKGEKSAFKVFSGWIKNLLNIGENVTDSAFEEFMSVSNQLMARGEFLATAQQFGERFFESKGKSGEYAKAQTLRALGLVTESSEGLTKSNIMVSLGLSDDTHNPKLARARAQAEAMMNEKGDEAQFVNSILSESGHSSLEDFIETAVAEGRDIGEALDLMPDVGNRFFFEKLRDHREVLEAVDAMRKAGELVNVADPKLLKPVGATIKAIDRVLAQEEKQREMAAELVGLDAMEPMGFLEKHARFASGQVPGPKEGLAPDKETQSWLANFLEPLGQLAKRVPEAAELISKLFQQSSNARRSFSTRVKVLGTDNSSDFISPEPTHESVKQMSKVFGNPKLLGAVNKWIYWNQKEGGKAVTMLSESHPEVAKSLASLTSEERILVQEAVANQSRSTQMGHKDVLDYMQKEATTTGAGVIMAGGGAGKLKDAVALSDGLLSGVLKMKDPMTQWQGQTEIQNIQQRMTPEAFLDALKFSQGEAEKIFAQKEYFDANPAWATAARTERFLIKGFRGKQRVTWQASSIKEAKDIVQKHGITSPDIKDQWTGNEDEPFAYPNMSPEMAKRMQEIELNQISMLESKGILNGKAEVEEFKRTSAVMQILREGAAENALPGVQTPPRLLSQGAEDLPWMWNHISHAQRESNYWSRRLLRAEARVHLKDPELASNEVIQKRLSTAVDNLLHPDPIAAQKMRSFMSTWFLGFNPATVLVNAAQPFTTHVAELTAMTGKPIDSYRRVLRALRLAGEHKFTGKDFGSPELTAFIKKATQDGEVGIGKYDDEAAAQESIAINYKRAMMKNKPQTLGQRLQTGAGIYSSVGMGLFQHGERLNSLSALIAGFELAREQGLSVGEASAKAYEFNRAVNFSGGRAQRPVGAFSGRGAFPRTTAMLGTSLQGYVLGTTAQIGRYLHSGLFRPAGLTPHEVYAARKAAIQMLGTQFAAAGLLGMPFVSGALALLDKMFPDLELNRKTREGLNDFLSSDGENGSVLTDIAMTGLPSMLGWDMQSRLSMGNTLPGVSEVNGFQAENLMGPASNIVKNFVGGVTGWASGTPGAGTKFLPPAAKKMIEGGMALLGGEGISDYAGRPLANPSTGEKVGLALGFSPKRLSDQNAAGRILKASEDNARRRSGQENQEMAEEVLKGNFGTVRQNLLQKSREEAGYDPVSAVRSIARAAEELSFPRDLRREGGSRTSNQRSSLLSSYSGITGQPSEVGRLQLRVKVEQGLGLPPTNLKSQLALATLMDQLRAAQPGATRSELRQAAERALRRSQPRLLELESESD